jgi:hypothetical protein
MGPAAPAIALAPLSRAMAPPHFPVDPTGLQGHWSFEGMEPGQHDVDGFRLTVHHGPGRTDDEVDALVRRLGRKDVEAAAEGDVWDTSTFAG